MSDLAPDQRHLAIEPLDQKTREEWLQLSAQVAVANAGPWPCRANKKLDAAAQSEPQSPVAPAYRLWMADNLAREARYLEAVKAFDTAIDYAQSARRFLPQVDFTYCALLHKAQSASLGGDFKHAISTYQELAKVSSDNAEPLFQAGLVAETDGNDDQAATFYRSVASKPPSSKTDDSAELARRALQRLENPRTHYMPSASALGDLLAKALENRDINQLDRFISKTHFTVGPLGGHTAFEELEVLEQFYRDLLESNVSAQRKLIGAGDKLYLMTRDWKGSWFQGDVVCLLTRAPKGWQWSGIAISQAHDIWTKRWLQETQITTQALPFTLEAPWPAGQSFRAGGLTEYLIKQAGVIAAGPLGGAALALGFARSACGFGPRGFYYNQGSTHDEEDAFAIDFTRYRRNVPYDNESGGTPVLATYDGIVAHVSAGKASGDSSASNTVEIIHADPNNPTDTDRFRSRYLHLAGPFLITVCPGMSVIVGQRLGLMDDTGNSILDHLHFSIHDKTIPHPKASYGSSVRPTPLSGVSLEDDDSGTCIRSNNVERAPGLLATEGKVTFLRAHEVGTGYGPPKDHLDVEVVVQLDSEPSRAFGFQLRNDENKRSRRRMLDVLRDAFNKDRPVRIDYFPTGLLNGRILRVMEII